MGLLAEMTWTQWLMAMLTISVCGLLILVVLIQRGRGAGLAGAFGGAGGGGGAFGAKTGDILTWITVGLAFVLVVLASVGNHVFDESPRAQAAAAVQGSTTLDTDDLPKTITINPEDMTIVPGTTAVPAPTALPPSAAIPGAENATGTAAPGGDKAAGDATKPGDAAPTETTTPPEGAGDDSKKPESPDEDNPGL